MSFLTTILGEHINHRTANLYLVGPGVDGDPFYDYVVWLVNSNGGNGTTNFIDESPFAWAIPVPSGQVQNVVLSSAGSRLPTGQATVNTLVNQVAAIMGTTGLNSVPVANNNVSFTAEAWFFADQDRLLFFSPVGATFNDVAQPTILILLSSASLWTITVYNETFSFGGGGVQFGVWNHICLEYNGTTKIARTSLNGVAFADRTVVGAAGTLGRIRTINGFRQDATATPGNIPQESYRVDGTRITYGIQRYNGAALFSPNQIFYAYGDTGASFPTACRWWRLYATAVDGSTSFASFCTLGAFISTNGTGINEFLGAGADTFMNGDAAIGAASYGADNPDPNSNECGSSLNTPPGTAPLPFIWAIVIPAAKAIQSVTLRAQRGGGGQQNRTPKNFLIQKSGNGIVWQTVRTVTNATAWGPLESRTYSW